MPRIFGEIGSDLVATGVPLRIAGKSQAREAAVASRRKQLQRIPPPMPSSRRLLRRLENREPAALLRQKMPDGKTSLAAPDDDHIEVIVDHGGCWCRASFMRFGHAGLLSREPRRAASALEALHR